MLKTYLQSQQNSCKLNFSGLRNNNVQSNPFLKALSFLEIKPDTFEKGSAFVKDKISESKSKVKKNINEKASDILDKLDKIKTEPKSQPLQRVMFTIDEVRFKDGKAIIKSTGEPVTGKVYGDECEITYIDGVCSKSIRYRHYDNKGKCIDDTERTYFTKNGEKYVTKENLYTGRRTTTNISEKKNEAIKAQEDLQSILDNKDNLSAEELRKQASEIRYKSKAQKEEIEKILKEKEDSEFIGNGISSSGIISTDQMIEKLRKRYKTEDVEFKIKGEAIPFERFIGSRLGSNDGSYVINKETGELFYAKLGGEQSKAENFAAEIYRSVGIEVPETKLFRTKDGKMGILSKYVPNSGAIQKPDSRLYDGFAIDALLGNWDALISNNVVSSGDKAVRIDVGGSLEFRAQCTKKENFGPMVDEIITLIDPEINPGTAYLLSDMTRDDLIKSLEKVTDDYFIWSAFDKTHYYNYNHQYDNVLYDRCEYLRNILYEIKNTPSKPCEDLLSYLKRVKINADEKWQILKPSADDLKPIESDEEYRDIINKLEHVKNNEGSLNYFLALLNEEGDFKYPLSDNPIYGCLLYTNNLSNYAVFNRYLSGRGIHAYDFDKRDKSDYKPCTLRVNTVCNLPERKEILDDTIRVIDYSLKKVDEKFGTYKGIVYRVGVVDPNCEQYWSATYNPEAALKFRNDHNKHGLFTIIKVKNGHKVKDVQNEVGDKRYSKEEEILIDRKSKLREIQKEEWDDEIKDAVNKLAETEEDSFCRDFIYESVKVYEEI